MFFILSKVLFFIISPSSWIIGLLIYALWTKDRKRKKRVIIANLVLFLFLTNTFLAQQTIGLWEYEKQNIAGVENYEVGILLGGYTLELKENYDFTTLSRNGNRLIQTVELYVAGKIKKIMLSGGNGTIGSDFEEVTSSLNVLQKMGVKREDIFFEKESRNTYENAIYSAKILKEKYPNGKFLLITSAFHQRRAMACFQKQGLNCDAFSADVKSKAKITLLNVVAPDTENIELWQITMKEIVGYLAYKMKGYL
ncbi:MAG: YdcF family protein [Saprospiraceae bacterium]